MFIQRLASNLPETSAYDARTLKRQVSSIAAGLDDVAPYLVPPAEKPYGRKLLLSNAAIEVIVMNWSPGRPCLPHDHGRSSGWVHVLAGAVEHTICKSDADGFPEPAHVSIEVPGSLIYAPAGMIHMMRALERSGPTVTLHFYTPPITGMRVFDPDEGQACIVADDCGAWWPQDEQLVALLPERPWYAGRNPEPHAPARAAWVAAARTRSRPGFTFTPRAGSDDESHALLYQWFDERCSGP
jgi:cysteine dioxygenase